MRNFDFNTLRKLAEISLALAKNVTAPGPLETLKLSIFPFKNLPIPWPALVQSPLGPPGPPSTLL